MIRLQPSSRSTKPVAALVGLDGSIAGRQAADFALAQGVRVRTTDAFTPDLIMDGNLGMPFLRNSVITRDLHAGTGWIAPAAEMERAAASVRRSGPFRHSRL